MKGPYPDEPQLIDSLVLFLDVLGTQFSADERDAQPHLELLHEAVTAASGQGGFSKEDPEYGLVTFTDNLVLGWPTKTGPSAEPQIGEILLNASYYQHEFVSRGIFVRGGLARGQLWMGSDFVFGPGLNRAYRLERTALQPRVALSRDVLRLARTHIAYYGRLRESPQYATILQDSDGVSFVNYLDIWRDPEEEFEDGLSNHKKVVEDALKKWRNNSAIWSKYRWVADYHNYFCGETYPSWPELLVSSERTASCFKRLTRPRKQR